LCAVRDDARPQVRETGSTGRCDIHQVTEAALGAVRNVRRACALSKANDRHRGNVTAVDSDFVVCIARASHVAGVECAQVAIITIAVRRAALWVRGAHAANLDAFREALVAGRRDARVVDNTVCIGITATRV
jgi:hypothetical protein